MKFDPSDIGNGALFAELHGDKLRYHVHRRKWLAWDGHTWQEDPCNVAAQQAAEQTADALKAVAYNITIPAVAPRATDEDGEPLPPSPAQEEAERSQAVAKAARKAARKWAEESRSHARLQAMLRRAEHHLAVSTQQFDRDPWLLCVANGALDLRTGELQAPLPSALHTRIAAATWDPAATSPAWAAFLHDITGGDRELEAYLQRAAGYALLGEWRERAFWFAYGPPAGGKSTFLAVLSGVLGSYAVTASASTWMMQQFSGGNRGDLVRLAGARLVTTSETTPGARFDTELMKRITGGDVVTAAAKYEGEIEFAPAFALWLAGNDRPVIAAGDEGLWSRVRCVPFVNAVPKERQDPTIAPRLKSGEHASAVLRWAFDGLQAYLSDGMGSCAAIDAAHAAYKAETNPLADFAEENLAITGDDADVASAADVRNRYTEWCYATHQRNPLHPHTFARAMVELGAVQMRLLDRKRTRAYRRVKLTF